MFIFRKLLLTLYFVNNIYACWIWASFCKDQSGFSSIPEDEKLFLHQQLNSLYDQSYYAPDGWAIAGTSNNENFYNEILVRSENAAYIDSVSYWLTVDSLLESWVGKIGMAHMRAASSGATGIPNPHPWIFNDGGQSFYLVHNGTVSKDVLHNLITSNGSDFSWFNQHPPQTFSSDNWDDINGWTNVVDSELILLFIMQEISVYGSVITGLQNALLSMINSGVSPGQLNIVFSNSSQLYIFGGYNGLSILESENYFSIMTQPPFDDASGSGTWNGIEGSELLVIDADGINYYNNFSGINDESMIAKKISLLSSYPNPFNGTLFIPYKISGSKSFTISISNILGKNIYQDKIFSNDNEHQGIIKWRPVNNQNRLVPSGTYLISLEAEGRVEYQKISYIK